MPDRISRHRSVFLGPMVAAAFAAGTIVAAGACMWGLHRGPLFRIDFDDLPLLHLVAATRVHVPPPAESVLVRDVPPDACVAFYGPGPCREHGSTVVGSTDAVAGPPPSTWRGKVAPPSPESRP